MLRPSATASRTAKPIARWRGITVCTSWRIPQLVTYRGDGGRDGAGYELLIIGRSELHHVQALRRNFDRNRRPGYIVQRTQRRRKISHGKLALLQFAGDRRRRALAQRQRRALRCGPRAEGPAVIFSVGKHCRVYPHSVAARTGVKRNVNRRVIGVGENGPLIDWKVRIRIAQHKSGHPAALQFLPQAARQGDGHVFLRERKAECFAAVVAAMTGVHDREVTTRRRRCNRSGSRRSRLSRRHWGWRRR